MFFRKELRRFPRLNCHWGASVRIGDTAHPAHVLNISRGGCLVRPVSPSLFLKAPTAVISVGGYDLAAILVRRQGRTWHFRFPVPLAADHFDVMYANMSGQAMDDELPGLTPALGWLR